MAPCLSKLPSVCLEVIFKHVPLSDLLYSIGLVCKSWYNSRRTELMRRRRLVIVQREKQLETLNYDRFYCSYGTDLIQHVRRDDGSPWLTLESFDQIKFNALVAPDGKLTNPFVSSLMNLSNITHMTLMLDYIKNSTLPQVIRLVDHFSGHLIELKLQICSFLDNDTDDNGDEDFDAALNEEKLATAHNVNDLFVCLDRLRSLRHLKLDLDFPHLNIRPPLTFLSRLTTLGIGVEGIQEDPFELMMMGIFDQDDWIISSLNEFAANVVSIDVYDMLSFGSELSQITEQLYTKFNILSLNMASVNYEDMALFCTRFTSLTKLRLRGLSFPMTKVAKCLSQLSQLVHLDLCLYPVPKVEQVDPDEEGGEQQPPEIVQVRSVRLLTVNFSVRSHHDTERLFISEIFPNLQVIRLRYYILECPDCAITTPQQSIIHNIENSEPELAGRLTECTHLLRQPLQHCANLRIISLVSLGKETLVTVDRQ